MRGPRVRNQAVDVQLRNSVLAAHGADVPQLSGQAARARRNLSTAVSDAVESRVRTIHRRRFPPSGDSATMQPTPFLRTFKEHSMAQKRSAAPKYLKTAEVAELLHVSPKTV